jgi:hypothetical protein
MNWNKIGARILLWGTVYLICAAVTWNYNPADWHWVLRLLAVIAVVKIAVDDLE